MYDKTGSISMADYRPSLTGSDKPVRVELLFSGITAIKKGLVVPFHIQDSPRPAPKCRPMCSPKFCRQHPRAVCSAIKVAEVSRSCQSPCQHTSCQACRFESEPKCKACQKDDFRCLKRYGKCVKRQYCTKRKYPCKPQYSRKQEGRFQCDVPRCS
eukprot:XP_019919819.1 PREDICTED: uncharacterized protein LOC105320919 isoform X2 [Crassostrea gigas]